MGGGFGLAPGTKISALPSALWIVTAAVLIVAALPLPYSYYTFCRIVTCVACSTLAFSTYEKPATAFWSSMFWLLAVLFNPVIPIHLTKKLWMMLDLGAAALILGHFASVRKDKAT